MTNRKITYRPISLEVEALVEHHQHNREAILEILKELDQRGHLNHETISDAARALGLPAHQVYGKATFYSMLALEPRKKILRVCDGPACWLKHATLKDDAERTDNRDLLAGWKEAMPAEWSVERSSCLGLCLHAPAVLVEKEPAGPVGHTEAEKVTNGWHGIPAAVSAPRPGEVRAMLARAGKIDPDDLEAAIKLGAYEGLKAALHKTPGQVIAEIEAAGLQGRGGAGFPVGRKWKLVAAQESRPKYMLCNADESEPLIFKDRVLIDSDPQQILEGMAIGGYACGASEGWIYIRGEYENQAGRLEKAIAQAEEKGLLGDNILGSGFSFHIHVHRGAGAYICGEETALIESLEGKRGEPRLRPPFPPTYGFRGQPTSVNNVESYAAVPGILKNGVDWWKSLGDGGTHGTKLYILLGHVQNPGVFEAPFGLSLGQIIEQFGGGMLPNSKFKFALAGGAAGTIVGPELLDVPLDYSSARQGISLGAGAFLVCDQHVSVVAFLRELLHFFREESCGKCTPCRVGTWRAHEILARLAGGQAQKGYLEELKALSNHMLLASFCGLGQSVSIPMNSALSNFAAEFEALES